MASRWRRRTTCLLVSDQAAPGTLLAINAASADLATAARPPLGRAVALHHPVAGMVPAQVSGHHAGGVRLSFARDKRAVSFALAVIAADMSRPG